MNIELKDYEIYRKDCIRFLFSLTNKKINYTTAEDIFQDSFIAFSKNIVKLNNNNLNIKNYIFQLCKNNYYREFGKNYRVKSKYINKKLDVSLLNEELQKDIIPNRYYQVCDYDYKLLLKTINEYSNNDKLIFLDYVNGYTIKEIASKYNNNYFSITTRICRMKNKLKQICKK